MPALKNGLVSVILPVFNRPEFLAEAAGYVFAQTYKNWELILVDDGSTDCTPEACRAVAEKCPERIRFVRQHNLGPGAARETGRLLAQGEFLQYLDSDDQIDPDKFDIMVRALRDNPSCGVAYCKTREFTRGQTHDGRCSQFTAERLPSLFPRLLSGCCWPTITPLIRREISDQIGPWLPLRQEEDWEYDSRLAAGGIRLTYCEQFLASAVNHSEHRASGSGLADKQKLRDRCAARLLILNRAIQSGILPTSPDLRTFASNLFLFSRQCGNEGLPAEARKMFDASVLAAGGARLKNQRFYGMAARLLGWSLAGRLAGARDSLRERIR